MLPGPDYIYKCPQCGQLISRGSPMSGNTFGAEFFSDTKSIAPMLPEFPRITICPKCNTIFWLSKAEDVGTKDKYTSHLFDDWRTAKIEKPKWWWGKRKREEYKEKEQWEDNCTQLINIFESKETIDSKLLIAEIKQNLAQFEDAIILLNGLYRKKLWWVIDQIKEECKKKNALVFQLDTFNSGKKDANPAEFNEEDMVIYSGKLQT